MTYTIVRDKGKYGNLFRHNVLVDGEEIGQIVPRFKTLNSNRPYAYQTEVMLEWDALSDETGFPNEYGTLTEAKDAVKDLMNRNGIEEQ